VRPSLVFRIGVQGFLVGLGALLLSVAAVVFLVFTWDRLSLGARALVIASITGTAMVGAAWLRPRLAETAEAVGGLAVVLVLADAWAVRATGLFGADHLDGEGYGVLATAICALVLLGWGRWGHLRAGSLAAVFIGPLSPILAGIWLAPDNLAYGLRSFGLGLLGTAMMTGVRRWAPTEWQAESHILRGAAVLSTALASAVAVALSSQLASMAELLALVTVSAVVQVVADGSASDSGRAWSFVAGACAVFAVAVAMLARTQALKLAPAWQLVIIPASAMAEPEVLVLAGRVRPVRYLDHRRTSRAARAAALFTCLPGVAIVGHQLLLVVLGALTRPWSVSPGATIAQLTDGMFSFGNPGLSNDGSSTTYLAAVLGLAAAAALLMASRPYRWISAVSALTALAVLGTGFSAHRAGGRAGQAVLAIIAASESA
jgi:hypothetical protein